MVVKKSAPLIVQEIQDTFLRIILNLIPLEESDSEALHAYMMVKSSLFNQIVTWRKSWFGHFTWFLSMDYPICRYYFLYGRVEI